MFYSIVSPSSWRSIPRRSLLTSSAPSPDLVRASLWMTGALLSFCAMAVAVRALSCTLKVMEILTIRNSGGLVGVRGGVWSEVGMRLPTASRKR
jgi:hypothetical protein